LLCGCVVLGPPPRSGLVFCSGDGVRLTSDDLVTVRLVADAAMVMHPQGEPRVITLCGMQYTVTRCERAHVLAVSKDEVGARALLPSGPFCVLSNDIQ
jgi:hypothetical protein